MATTPPNEDLAASFFLGKSICLLDLIKYFIIQIGYIADDEMGRPSSRVRLGFRRHPVRIQRSRKPQRKHEIVFGQF